MGVAGIDIMERFLLTLLLLFIASTTASTTASTESGNITSGSNTSRQGRDYVAPGMQGAYAPPVHMTGGHGGGHGQVGGGQYGAPMMMSSGGGNHGHYAIPPIVMVSG